MEQLIQNRYFKHTDTNTVIKSAIEKNESDQYCLYIELEQGDGIIGASGTKQSCYQLSSPEYMDNWKESLERFVSENNYEDFNPFKMEAQDAANFIQKCRGMMQQYQGLRLGQTIINELGEKTPTPNIKIFNSLDENEVLTWFYENYAV